MFPSHSPAIYDFLKEHRLVPPGQLDELNEEHKATGKPLADVVVDLGLVDKDDLLRRLADHLGYDFLQELPVQFPGEAIAALTGKLARDYGVMPLQADDQNIDLLVTDHAPHHYDEKEREFADAPNGIVGLETALGVNITWLLEPGVLSLPDLVDRMSCRPAKVFHLPGGTLAKGAPADVSVFDPTRRWTVDPSRFKSKGRNTPYGGRELTGRATCTVVDGRIVHRLEE